MKKISFCIMFILAAGCSPYGPEELDRLTKEDPEYKLMIQSRDQTYEQIHIIKSDLLLKKKAKDSEVNRLRQEYDDYAKTQNQKIEKLKAVIETNRQILAQEIQTSSARLAAKEKELQNDKQTLDSIKKMLKESRDIKVSSRERQKWEERILMLNEKMRPLIDEIEEIKIDIRLKKRKLGFLH